MAANLVSVVMQFLTPEIIAKIASALGLDRAMVQRAIGAAVPGLLATLGDVASTPAGARQVANMVTQQSGALDSFKSLIGTGPNNLAESGTSMLSGLFGGGAMDTLAQTIGRFAGVDTASSKSLLGLLGPIVFGALGQHQRSAGLDASGVASLLSSQRDQIASAMPPGLADQLNAAGLIDRASGAARSGAAAASAAANRVAGTGQSAYAAATSNASSQWPYWLAALVVLGGVAYYALRAPNETVAQLPPGTTKTQSSTGTVGLAPADLTIGGVNLANEVNSSFGTLKSTLPTITDATSAQTALPKLQQAMTQLNDVGNLSTKLTPEGKSALARLITASMPTINEMCDKVLATPGGSVAKPVIDELRAKLDTLSHA